MIKKEYIDSEDGSTLRQLKQAATDQGMYAVALRNLTCSILRQCRYPLILHVKATPASDDYDHFVLYLGQQNGQARVFDPMTRTKPVPFYELASRWDGMGLLLSADSPDLTMLYRPAAYRLLTLGCLFAVWIVLIRLSQRMLWPQGTGRVEWARNLVYAAVGGAVIVMTSIAAGMTYHYVSDEGFLAHGKSTVAIDDAYRGSFLPKIGATEASRLLGTGVVFVDARLPTDYSRGHIDGAVSVPVTYSNEDRHKAMARVSKNTYIVVYCQSARCRFAESVAVALLSDGYRHVVIFRGGWVAWLDRHG